MAIITPKHVAWTLAAATTVVAALAWAFFSGTIGDMIGWFIYGK